MTFVVKLKCKNCGNEWNILFMVNYVVEETTLDSVHVYDEYSNLIKVVKCPICGVDNKLILEDRIPINEVFDFSG